MSDRDEDARPDTGPTSPDSEQRPPDGPVARSGLGTLSRRVRTLIVAGVAFLVLFVLALTMPVPYVLLTPGPTFNTLGTDGSGHTIIVLKGRTARATTGHLNMTTVDVDPGSLTAFAALKGWLEHDEVVVPRAAVFPPGQSEQQVNQQNTQEFSQSQDSAVAAASCQLGYPKRFGVLSVLSPGASYGKLEPSDLITTLDGKPATTQKTLEAAMGDDPAGTTVAIGLLRAGKPLTVSVKLGKPLANRTSGSLGILLSPDICQMPFTVDLGLGNQIGGPSAGLMFALGIMDKVGTVDLTHGRFIAGTGTITAAGTVGPIGGIQLKMIAARDAGATVFLAPAGNCADVRGATPSGLQIIRVTSLSQAVTELNNLAAGKPVPSC